MDWTPLSLKLFISDILSQRWKSWLACHQCTSSQAFPAKGKGHHFQVVQVKTQEAADFLLSSSPPTYSPSLLKSAMQLSKSLS
jgi:hypothetical protein